MGCLCGNSTLLLLGVIFIGQVSGSPFLYWSQPDCNQQNTDYSYGQPTYQQTMRDMVDETIRAICDIMRVAARAAKQELSEIAKIFYRHYQNTACTELPPSGYPGESVGEIYITTSDPENEVTSTSSSSLSENKFVNVNDSSTEPTVETKSTTQTPPTEKQIFNSTEVSSSSSNYDYSTSAPVEEIDLTTLTFPMTEDSYSQTAPTTEGTRELTSLPNA